METINISTTGRSDLVDITAEVQAIAGKENVKSGLCLIFCPHTTAGLTINENADPAVKSDILNYLEKLVPQSRSFTHAEGNSDSHIKASMMGFSLSLIIEKGTLILGTWQGIYFCEFDGPRQRKVIVKIVEN
jgi:secondary thiamine-phosphate synthase enzyme